MLESAKLAPMEIRKKRTAAVKKWLKEQKNKNWEKVVEENASGMKYFKLVNNLVRKGKINPNSHEMQQAKAKLPQVEHNLDYTEKKWTGFYNGKFWSDEVLDLRDDELSYEFLLADEELVELCLQKCKNTSAPGKSGISYRLLKLIFNHDKIYFTQLINNILNNNTYSEHFETLTVIPIFKPGKKDLCDVKSWRPVCLGECMYMLVESVYIKMNQEVIEKSLGPNQFAYKTGGGTNKAFVNLKRMLDANPRGKYLVALDLAAAFDSVKRKPLLKLLRRKWGNSPFLDLYSKLLNNLKMEVNLGFKTVKGIRSKLGCPQGLKGSVFAFSAALGEVMTRVQALLPNLSFQLYSDDILLLCETQDEINQAIETIVNELKEYGMKLELAKTSIIRYGKDNTLDSKVYINYIGNSIQCDPQMKYLGFFLKDLDDLNTKFHLESRLKHVNKHTTSMMLDWICKSYKTNFRIKRLYFMNKVMASLFYGVPIVNSYCSNFEEKYVYLKEGKKFLLPIWIKDHKWDDISRDHLLPLVASLGFGMYYKEIICAVFRIKPLIAVGYKLTDDTQISEYWLTRSMSSMKPYVRQSYHVIHGLMKMKWRLKNQTQLISLLCGQYDCWLNYAMPIHKKCYKCNSYYDRSCYYSKKECCGLEIPGKVPIKDVTTSDHVVFLKFVDRLVFHPMFINWFQGYRWKSEGKNTYTIKNKVENNIIQEAKYYNQIFILPQLDLKDCYKQIYCYTDGSAVLGKYAGAGVYYLAAEYWGLANKSEIVPGKKSNQNAELYAIKVALQDTHHLKVPLNIRSDSMYSINILTKWWKKWKWNSGRTTAGNMVSHSQLVEEVLALMKGRVVNFMKVKSHIGIIFNEMADSLANKGSNKDRDENG